MALINDTPLLIMVMLVIVAFSLWAQKFKLGAALGPALVAIIIGIILNNCGIVPSWHDSYGTVMDYCVPMSLSIMLLSFDLKTMKNLTRDAGTAMALAVFSVCVTAFVFGILFANTVQEGWKVAGMFVGTYTGGSANLTAIANGLQASADTIAAANAADYAVGIPWMILAFAAPRLMRRSKWFNKIWPYHYSDEELRGDGSQSARLMAAKEWSIGDLSSLLAIGMVVTMAATIISNTFFPESFATAGRVLLVTTLALISAQIPYVKALRGKMDLGLFLAIFYLVIIGFIVNLQGFFESSISITLLCLSVIVVSTLLHLVLSRLFKVKYEYVLLAIVASVVDDTSSALVANNGGWEKLIPVGLIMGVIGYAVGNYCGIGVAYLVKFVTM